MAASGFITTITTPTSTGNQSYSGLGFQPIAVIFYATRQTGTGSSANNHMLLGVATSSSARGVVIPQSSDGLGSSTAGTRKDTTKCIRINDSNNNALAAADFVSMDADGFTLNWTTANATQYKVYAMSLGGSDITNANLVEIRPSSSTGNQAFTGVGFQPDSIFLFTSSSNTAGSTAFGTGIIGHGIATSASARAGISQRENNVATPTITKKSQLTGNVEFYTNGGTSYTIKADFVSMDADGFTLNYSTASQHYTFVLCLKGARFKVGSFNQATSTGNQSVTGVGFTPVGVILESFNGATSSTVDANVQWSFGMATSSSSRVSMWNGSLDANTGVKCDMNSDTANVLKMYTPVGGGSPSALTVADYVSNDSDGFTINNTTTDATAREIIYFAFGSSSSAVQPNGFMTVNTGFWGI